MQIKSQINYITININNLVIYPAYDMCLVYWFDQPVRSLAGHATATVIRVDHVKSHNHDDNISLCKHIDSGILIINRDGMSHMAYFFPMKNTSE